MKCLVGILLLIAFSGLSFGQACGYSHATLFVSDSSGARLRNVEFVFLRKGTNEAILYAKEEVRWSDELSAYKLRHGICGAHRDVRLIIKAKGFEELERVIDLPLNSPDRPQVFEFHVKRTTARKSVRKVQ